MPSTTSIAVALAASAALVTANPPPDYGLRRKYDYIIVGAGASGLTVANRLTENPKTTVLVIEAGDFDNNEDFVTIPGLAGGAIGTKYDWNLTYVASDALNGRNVSLAQGKVVGGSTKLNRMVFDRGSKSDYNRWATLGNKGWDWTSLLPYFKKNEIFTPPTEEIVAEYNVTYDPAYHGFQGYMHSTYAPFFWPTTKNIARAIKELRLPIPKDQASGDAIGGYYCPHNQDPTTQTRSSAEEAYYDTVKNRSNLKIITGQQVTRILTSKKSGNVKVTGVEYASSKTGPRQTISVNKEAILAAGTIHTPQLLQVSGIGDPKTLTAIGVPTIVNLPGVGQNLQDHTLVTVVNVINATYVSSLLTSNATFAAAARAQYDSQKKGPYTDPTGDFLAFLPLPMFTSASARIQASALAQNSSAFLPADASAEVKQGYERQFAVLNERLVSNDSAILEILWADGVFVLGLEHPYSRGSVRTVSKNVFDGVIADAGFLRNPLDVTILTEGIRLARKLASTNAIQELAPFEVVPGGNITGDADLEQFIRGSSGTLWHPAGSCHMGARAEGGVVDNNLRVYGVQGLRVVDASVMPLLPATHTMTTVYAVAEKAADLIKQG